MDGNFIFLYTITVFLASIVPGPSMILALNHGIRYGTRPVLASALGNSDRDGYFSGNWKVKLDVRVPYLVQGLLSNIHSRGFPLSLDSQFAMQGHDISYETSWPCMVPPDLL